MSKKWIYLFFMLVAANAMDVNTAFAVFDLSISPDRGGKEIRFTPAKGGKEVRNEEATVTITSDEGVRYRLIQQQLTPFTNERGQILSPGAVKVFTPSSVLGTSSIVFPTSLTSGQKTIYTSDSLGSQDSFKLVFALQSKPGDAAGHYRAQLIYQLEPNEGSLSTVTVVTHVHVEIVPEFSLKIRNAKGGTSLNLGSVNQRRIEGEGVLEFEITTSLGSPYRIYQQLNEPLLNASGEWIDEENIRFKVSRPTTGAARTPEGRLSTNRQVLYESDAHGSATAFQVQYETLKAGEAEAGIYNSTLQFFIESNSPLIPQAPETVSVQLEIETLFYLEVEEESSGGLHFGRFKVQGDTQTRRIKIQTHNNTGEAYHVVQRTSRPFTNDEGDTLDSGHFKMKVSGAEHGKPQFTAAQNVEVGDSVLYISETDGRADHFIIDYNLTLPPDARGGNYTSDTTYTMSVL